MTYTLMVYVELHSDVSPKLYVMMFIQSLDEGDEGTTNVFDGLLSDKDLLLNIQKGIKQTGVMFDTSKYSEQLVSFLKVLSKSDPIFRCGN